MRAEVSAEAPVNSEASVFEKTVDPTPPSAPRLHGSWPANIEEMMAAKPLIVKKIFEYNHRSANNFEEMVLSEPLIVNNIIEYNHKSANKFEAQNADQDTIQKL